MIATPKPRSGPLHAVLREVEPGLYRAEYSGEINPENPDEREVPDFHVGTDAAGVKHWVEEMASGLGYDEVVWDPPGRT
jgi:hypothetical protein